ncbi:hypothetical protein [Georgenia sp. SUBG003]|uniref:hypothetical protein n=1 Tax=Georgenia sp. SUBG003 TaxID=1497974 RepID=UPI003AB702E9
MDDRARGTSLRLVLPAPAAAPPVLDPAQASAVAWPAGAGNLLVVGAPGTGKTTTAIETFLVRRRAARAVQPAVDAPGGAW